MSEQKSPLEEHAVWEELIEIIEVIVLALVAMATAWSGYQAAKWDGGRFRRLRPQPGR